MTTDAMPNGSEVEARSVSAKWIPVDRIITSYLNPRKTFDESSLEELSQSIKAHGILEPLIVRPIPFSETGVRDQYDLVAGERRLRAAKLASLKEVPAIVRHINDRQVKEIMLLENLQREDLHPLEEAEALRVILEDGSMDQKDLAARIGRSPSWVSNRLRLLEAPEDLRELLLSKEITPKHAQRLIPFAGYPVYGKIMDRLKDSLRDRGLPSVANLEESIRHAVRGDWTHNFTMRILEEGEETPWELREIGDFIDFSDCRGCKHTYGMDTVDEFHDPETGELVNEIRTQYYCLNPECFKVKMAEAEEKRNKSMAAIDTAKPVDKSKLRYGEYGDLTYEKWDKSDCEGCKKCGKTEKGQLVCFDLKCFKEHQKAYNRQQKRLDKKAQERVLAKLEEYVDQMHNELPPGVLRMLIINKSYDNRDYAPLKKYGKVTSADSKHLKELVEKIPDEELLGEYLTLLIWDRLANKDRPTEEDLVREIERWGA